MMCISLHLEADECVASQEYKRAAANETQLREKAPKLVLEGETWRLEMIQMSALAFASRAL